jgi:predicted ATPase
MNHPFRGGLTFHPALEEFATSRSDKPVTVLSGGNNSGKSLVLKWLKISLGKSAYLIGTNRFYHVYHFSTQVKDPRDLDNYENQFQSQVWNENYNYEQNYIDLNKIISSLSDSQRTELFSLCGSLLGSTIRMLRVEPDNDLSNRYIDIDGQNLSVASTGTRLLLTILGICMDRRFETILIDEPELGLSPRIQRALSDFLQDGESRARIFPHLRRVILATHSQHFLHRHDITSNFIVSKSRADISIRHVSDIAEFHQLQFNLLGNSLEGLFLPSTIVFVEGDSDLQYLSRVLATKFKDRNLVLVKTDGDPKKKVYALRETLGDLQTSPLRSRLFVVVDSVHNKTLKADLVAIGLLPENFVVWDKNGIEFLYPEELMCAQFKCTPEQLTSIDISGDNVAINGITKRKRELGAEVASRIDATIKFPQELLEKLIAPIERAIG